MNSAKSAFDHVMGNKNLQLAAKIAAILLK